MIADVTVPFMDSTISITTKGFLIAGGLALGWVLWTAGVFNMGHRESPLRKARLRREAYGVVAAAFHVKEPTSKGSDALQRSVRQHHRKMIVRKIRRHGRWARYVELQLPKGTNSSEGSRERLTFEQLWRENMTEPLDGGRPSHDWEFVYYTGTRVVAVRWAPLTTNDVKRLFQHLKPMFKWPEGVRASDVVSRRIR